MSAEARVVQDRLRLLELARRLGNVSQACRLAGVSRDSFYRFRALHQRGGTQALERPSRRRPLLKNRVAQGVEDAVLTLASLEPGWGQVRVARELAAQGIAISPSGVRCVWVRHDLRTTADRLRALAAPRRAPRLADRIAAELRRRVLAGEIADGASLPKQQALLEEFRVSAPPMREALRILESEGLITVRRGSVGGASVHVPSPANAAYTIGCVLQARRVTLHDLGLAIQRIEPACLELAALRPDRQATLLPALRRLQQAARESLDDATRYRAIARRIHALFVEASGCETLILIAGTLEALWIAHAQRRAIRGRWPDPVTRAVRERHLRAHGRIIDAIAAGDARRAAALSRRHLAEATRHTLTDRDAIGIDASALAPLR